MNFISYSNPVVIPISKILSLLEYDNKIAAKISYPQECVTKPRSNKILIFDSESQLISWTIDYIYSDLLDICCKNIMKSRVANSTYFDVNGTIKNMTIDLIISRYVKYGIGDNSMVLDLHSVYIDPQYPWITFSSTTRAKTYRNALINNILNRLNAHLEKNVVNH